MSQQITGEQVRDAVKAAGINWVENHECSLCGVPVGYVIDDGRVFYRSGCGCSWSPDRPTDWDDCAEWINMQRMPEHRAGVAAKFGIKLEAGA